MSFEIRDCPYCSNPCEADWVDVGVGHVQCGPYHCLVCGASEIGPNDKDRPLSGAESRTGWYGPGSEPGSSANVVAGRIVSHTVAREIYNREWTNNPLYHVPGEVEAWRQHIRKRGFSETPHPLSNPALGN